MCMLREVIFFQSKLKVFFFFFACSLVVVTVATSTLSGLKRGIWKVDVYVTDVSPT